MIFFIVKSTGEWWLKVTDLSLVKADIRQS